MIPHLLPALLALSSGAAPPWTWEPDPFVTAPAPVLVATTPPPPPITPLPPEAVPGAAPAPAPTWYDEGHAIVSEGLFWSVERLDQFFGDERQVDLPRARSYVRWRNDLTLRDDGTAAFTTGLRAELRIPSLDRRLKALRITIAGGTTDALDRLLPGDAPSPDAVNQPSAGLKLFLLDTLLTQTDLQAGLLATLPVGWYARLRLRHVRPVEDLLVARFALSTFWQTPTGWGTRQDADLERQLAPWLLLRLANTGTVTQRSRGWEWSSELALLAAVGQRTALFLGGGPAGATDVGPVVETWKVHARARRDVLRRWLFLEVEPGVAWTRPAGGGRQRERSVILRLDLQFDAASRAARAPAPVLAPGGG